ncbi:MAG: MerR family transcriptional regulator [Rhodobacteraceae bacterium]|nr:MerR family transcriptional regulator [Paracoccaceae bacterium]
MAKSRDAFRTISEVSDWLETPAHVLRFWESRFSQIKPVKRAGGRRYYRPVDMELLGGIKRLLHDDGITIKGVQKILREKGVKYVASLSLETPGDGLADLGPEPPEETPVDALIAAAAPVDEPEMIAPGADWSASDPADDDGLVLSEAPDDDAASAVSPVLETAIPPAPPVAPPAPAERFVAPRPVAAEPPAATPAQPAAPAPRVSPDRPPAARSAADGDRLDELYARLAALRNRLRNEVSAS